MNVSYKWLKEYVDFDLSAEEVSAALTSIGLEVDGLEEVQSIRGGLKGLVVGHVLTCEPHPNSDHMHVCSVDLGEGEPVQIVCGAPNVQADQKVIVATLGTKLYDGDKEFVIKKSKLRGIDSYGMICAEDEIGVGDSHDGIIVLSKETKVGMPAAEYYNVESDYLIEVDLTANRIDAASHFGVARDLYAWLKRNGYKTNLHRPSIDEFHVNNCDLNIDVKIENPEACPHYCAVTIKDCVVKESPKWLQEKLTTIGLRPINNIVDITNYIMMAYGQPLHCFDADMIEGHQIVVKSLPNGTPFITLDGEEHVLSDHDLAICNSKEPMCIAGVFGGKGSGTYETTKNVLLESAYFNPTWIRKSARRHGLSTDASFRFERGIDPNGQLYALKAAAIMVKQLAGGTISMEIKDVEAREIPKFFPVELDYQYVDTLIGKHLPSEVIKEIASSLEMKIVDETEQGLSLHVPAYRVDVQRPCDVVEDILRIYGYNNIEIPSTMNTCLTVEGETDRSNKLQKLIAQQLIGQGFNEIMNNSLTKESYYDELKSYPKNHLVHIMNPLSSDLNVMRQSLLFGGLESIARNVNRRMSNLRFFEVGNVYSFDGSRRKQLSDEEKQGATDADFRDGGKLERLAEKDHMAAYSEECHLGLWLTGNHVEGNWAHPNEASSVYEMKAYVVGVLQRLGVQFSGLLIQDGTCDIFSKSLRIADRNGKVLVEFGIVAKSLLVTQGIENEVYFADFNWIELMRKTRKNKVEFTEISKFPAVSRDLALLVNTDVQFKQIEDIAYKADKKLLKKVSLFDVYEGKKLEPGKKSYAVNFTLQDESKTMNDKQVDAVMNKIITSLQKQLDAKLR